MNYHYSYCCYVVIVIHSVSEKGPLFLPFIMH